MPSRDTKTKANMMFDATNLDQMLTATKRGDSTVQAERDDFRVFRYKFTYLHTSSMHAELSIKHTTSLSY